MSTRGQGISLTFNPDPGMAISKISLKANGQIVTKYYAKPPRAEGTKILGNKNKDPGHMTNMAVMSIYDKTFKNLLPRDQFSDGKVKFDFCAFILGK